MKNMVKMAVTTVIKAIHTIQRAASAVTSPKPVLPVPLYTGPTAITPIPISAQCAAM